MQHLLVLVSFLKCSPRCVVVAMNNVVSPVVFFSICGMAGNFGQAEVCMYIKMMSKLATELISCDQTVQNVC